ncbi:hypothetical protein HSBAA_44990 [Vreelandella sulfidaeris]|uniref:Uncharacterized protein n=1 Tax=Vreelandella sulfidaeris TaxID=115553 RepID=A0A455UD19_9GAMM|nr:hypothetical protein HSBAA_44990 [Halomonas sulfidaeris]
MDNDAFTLGQHAGQQGAVQPHGRKQIEIKLALPHRLTKGCEAAAGRG